MKKIRVQGFTIFVGSGLIKRISSLIPLRTYAKSIIITGTNTPAALVKKLQAALPQNNDVITVNTGEKNKSIETVATIWKKLHDAGCDRKSVIINLGGGIISDIGGFSAGTYLKGIHYVNIPTTLLGQVDASNGGKTGINFDGAKNLVGLFESPIAVISDVSTLTTLPEREFTSGFAEIIKNGLICDKKYFQFATSKKPTEFTQRELIAIVSSSCKIKARIITNDMKETGMGKVLNFGHTVGHILEISSQQWTHPMFHGEAVMLGMMIETRISLLMDLLTKKESELVQRVLANMMDLQMFEGNISISALFKTLQHNNSNGMLRWTLLRSIGQATVNVRVPDTVIHTALQQILYERQCQHYHSGI